MQENVSDYNKDYYKENRARILAQKKEKYLNDPEYRATIARCRKESKSRQRENIEPYVRRTINGKEVLVLKVGYVLKELGISRATFMNWEAIGLLPAAEEIFGNSRCYTDKQFELISEINAQYKKGVVNILIKERIGKKIASRWVSNL